MGRFFDYIVRHKGIIAVVIAIIAAVCAVLMTRVVINTDMTKYLPESSSMIQGIDLISQEFPDMENSNTIRVMFEGISEKDANEIYAQLEDIEYVKSVDYEEDSRDYVRDDYRLFILTTAYDYESSEEESIISSVEEKFEGYNVEIKDDNPNPSYIPGLPILIAVVLLVFIMLIMCASWLEPILFMITIGVAIVINLGTNIFLDSVASITYAVAAILQLVLSMDYSIILSNRYRQERAIISDKRQAMSSAMKNAFASICSSSLTTFVGLLCLVFMSFKIGFNLGVVLAKGVVCSLICVMTLLPVLLLVCDKGVEKTAKKPVSIPTDGLARFSYTGRKVIPVAFVIVFAGAIYLHNFTDTTFNLDYEDPIADVFPKTNSIVVIYNNDDEEGAARIADNLSQNKYVKSVQSYGETLGKKYSPVKMAESINEFSDDESIDENKIKFIYYMCFDGKISPMTMAEFVRFLDEDIADDENFAQFTMSDMDKNIDLMKKYTDRDALLKPMTNTELSSYMGMGKSELEDIFLYYHMVKNDIKPGKMTVSRFARFISQDVAKDPKYSNMVDSRQLSQIKKLSVFTDKEKINKKRTVNSAVKVLGIPKSQTELLYVYLYANNPSYTAPDVKISDFVGFMNKDAVNNPLIGGNIGAETRKQLKMLSVYTDVSVIGTKMDASSLAEITGMDKKMVEQILAMSGTSTMTPYEFISQVAYMQPENEETGFVKMIMETALSGQKLDSSNMAALLGMKQSDIQILYIYYDLLYGKTRFKASIKELIGIAASNAETTTPELVKANKIIKAADNGTELSPAKMAKLLGMKKSDAEKIYILYKVEKGEGKNTRISPYDLVCFIGDNVLGNPEYGSMIGDGERNNLLMARKIMKSSITGEKLSPQKMIEIFGGFSDKLNRNNMELLYLYHGALTKSDPWKKISIEEMVNYVSEVLAEDKRFEDILTDDFREELEEYKNTIVEGREQLMSENFSLMSITTLLPQEGKETMNFVSNLDDDFSKLSGEYHLIGNSAMNYEMDKTFSREMLIVTLLTALAIFIVVALTFRSVIIPLILVLIVQCGVYLTISYIGISGNSIYYLAMLIVQCILMGATIDYAILFTSYYRENRKLIGIKESLQKAYRGSIHTIMTSGLIICIVTAVLSHTYGDPSVEQICKTISIGALCAILLILFVLPSILACFDKLVIGKNMRKE